MKAVILAGGRGTRISEESQSRPKPMVEIGGKPILWHIMKIYAAAGINDFVVLLGYKGYMVKEYFANYFLHESDVTIDLSSNSVEVLQNSAEPWRVTLLDTGAETMTGGRLLRARHHLAGEDFCFTYGDGLIDLDIAKVVDWHESHHRALTVTAVQPPGRYGALTFDGDDVQFEEKPHGASGWVNGGFFVASPKVFDYLEGDDTVFERAPLEQLSRDGELMAYQHHGFWHGMDTLWDKILLERLWDDNAAPWKIWT
jgi:glucose-1-phosphate cytidylyltransferase